MQRTIVATSGGFVGTGLWGVVKPAATFLRALELTGKESPRILFVMTASGDDQSYLTQMYSAVASLSCSVDHLSVFPQPNRDPRTAIVNADLIWVGGGSVANLLALWRLHGIDTAIAEAWDSGTVLAGVSAGSICWHVGGPTDSFGSTLQPVTDGLGLLPFGNGVHYDSEEQRRPLLHQLVRERILPTSFATDDRVGIVYRDQEPREVITDTEGPSAYRVELVGGDVVETRLPAGRI